MKLLRQEEGYSIYENPDKELVEKIKNHPTPTKFEGHWKLNNGVWSLKEVLDNGKYLMISEEGDMTTIDKEDYDELVIDTKLESINATFLVSGYMNRGEHEGQVGVSLCRYSYSVESWNRCGFK